MPTTLRDDLDTRRYPSAEIDWWTIHQYTVGEHVASDFVKTCVGQRANDPGRHCQKVCVSGLSLGDHGHRNLTSFYSYQKLSDALEQLRDFIVRAVVRVVGG